MNRTKIDFGIDLGTTNSATARTYNGEPKIIKSDLQTDTIPSCIGVNKKKVIQAGGSAWNKLKSEKLSAIRHWDTSSINTFIEFKRTMGTDKGYSGSFLSKEFNSEELSAEVLKKLRSFITDEECNAAVITVPAKFDIRQKDATLRAAKLAGFEQVELLQEPIAASMAFGLSNQNKDGYWLVFDFGGGTFDAALMKVEDGIMKVVDTDGDNYLGGKNLDYAIVDEVILPYLESEYAMESILGDVQKKQIFQEGMKYYAEEAKISLSFNSEHNIISDLGDIPTVDDDGEELELDITLARPELKKVIGPIFQRAIEIAQNLLKRHNLRGQELTSLILVGGPTYSTILREMLAEQITAPDTSIDPMTAVSVGAALYASTINLAEEIVEESRDRSRIQLEIGYEASSVETEEWVTIKMLPEKSDGTIPEMVQAEVTRHDKAWASGKKSIDEKGEIVEVSLIPGKSNGFQIQLYDGLGNRLDCQPDQFSILQGSVGGTATLPHCIGLGVKRKLDGKLIFKTIKGLEKNQSLPATGVSAGLKTQQQIRPGNAEDEINIPIYQGDHDSEGSRTIYNEFAYDVIITGEHLPGLLPEGSDVEVTLTTDKSGRIEKIEAFFPVLEFTVEPPIPSVLATEVSSEKLDQEINGGLQAIKKLKNDSHVSPDELNSLTDELMYLQNRLDQGRNDYDRKREVLESLRRSLRKIDELNDAGEWPRLEQEIREEFDNLEKANKDLGNDRSTELVNHLRRQVEDVLATKNVNVGNVLLEEIDGLYFSLTLLYQLIGMVRHHGENFGAFRWKDPQRARQLIQQGELIIVDEPTPDRLHPIVVELISLLPKDETSGDDLKLLLG